MARLPVSGAALVLGFLAGAVAAAADAGTERMVPVPASAPIPVRNFVLSVLRQPPAINRAGTYLADVCPDKNGFPELAIEDLATGASRFLSPGVSLCWVADDLLMYNYNGFFCIVQAETLEVRKRYWAVPIVGLADQHAPPVHAWVRRDSDGPLKIDVLSGLADVRADAPSEGTCIAYLPDKDGELAYALTMEDGIPSLQRLAGERWRKCPVDLDKVRPVGVGDRPGELIVLDPAQPGMPWAIRRMDSVSGRLGEVLYQDRDYDFGSGSLFRSRSTGAVLGLSFIRGGTVRRLVRHRDSAELQARLNRAYPGMVVEIVGTDDAERRVIFSTSSDVFPGAYYLFDRDTGSTRLLRATAPWIDPKGLLPMRAITYQARDGRPIEGYLTLPASAAGGLPPLVVLPHGGPWMRDWPEYSGTVQLLASRGYAVFQPNYRGSTGYDWRFAVEDRWNFGKMSEDVADGTRYLMKSGLIDPKRVAILGSGFGGYLAMCGAAFEPDLSAAITMSGVFDWSEIVKGSRVNLFSGNTAYDTFRRHIWGMSTPRPGIR